MEQLIVLGTGNALSTKFYNTCFAFNIDDNYILVDAGGGNGILTQLEKANINTQNIKHLIVTHEHCDHLLGVVWVYRKIATMIKNGSYDGVFNVWCHEELANSITILLKLTLEKKFTDLLGSKIILNIVSNGQVQTLLGRTFTFFDIHSTKAKQYGFSMLTALNEKVTCLGDEPYNITCEKYVKGTTTLLSEAFCLYSQREKFKPYEKHHATVRETCELAQELNVKRLVLWHTEDENHKTRKQLYTKEGLNYYKGILLVPNDLDIINLSSLL